MRRRLRNPTFHPRPGELRTDFALILVLLAAATSCGRQERSRRGREVAAVEVAPIAHGEITLRRTFSGSLEAMAEFVVSPKVGGRIQRVHCDIGDAVQRGQVVVELDADEFRQQVVQAQADLAVAKARVSEAESALEIAMRELERVTELRGSGIASDARLDTARAEHKAATAQREVAVAQVRRAAAVLQGARVRLGYTRITADWTEGDDTRAVAERFIDEGETVSPNAPLLSIVELDPLVGVVFVPERDYPRVEVGQKVWLTTDAHPNERFEATVRRIAPVFRPGSRQARVELVLDNADQRLKPGLFVRATIVLDHVADATIVPRAALTLRDEVIGVFVVDAEGKSVLWRRVEVGIQEDERVQVTGEGLEGRVVTLGQQLLDDGSPISVAPRGPERAGERG